MGVFQRNAEHSPHPPHGGNFQRRRSVDKKRRYSHPSGEQNSFDTIEKWSPTIPPPEVVEADLSTEKGTIPGSQDFSAWTGEPDDGPQTHLIHSDPSLNRSLGPYPVPKPRTSRGSKDPYAKRKAHFNQKPKLAPITETDSGGDTDSARSSRTSAVYENVVIGMEKSMNSPIIEEEAVMFPGSEEALEKEEKLEKDNNNKDRIIENNLKDNSEDSNKHAYYQNVRLDEGGSMVVSLNDGLMPQNDLNKENEEEPLYDFVGGHLAAASSSSDDNTEKCDSEKEINGEEDVKEKEDEDKEKNVEVPKEESPPIEADMVGTDSLKRDTGVGDGIISQEDLTGQFGQDDGFPRPNSPPAKSTSTSAGTSTEIFASTGSLAMDTRRDNDLLGSQDFSSAINSNGDLRKTKPAYEIEDVETKDTGVGTSTDDMGVHASFEDLQLEIEEATGILDEVVFGKGRSTQTGNSLRWGGERSNQIVEVMNRANDNHRPVSECIVVDSTTNTLETVAIGSTESLTANKADMTSAFSETNISSLVSPSVLAEPQQRMVKSKKMIALIVVFFIIILAIIAAGVVIYFVYVQQQNPPPSSYSYYYVGMELAGKEYESALQERDDSKYISYSTDICTFLKEVYTSTVLRKAYKGCSITEFRRRNDGKLIVHASIKFDGQSILDSLKEHTATLSVIDTLKWNLENYLDSNNPPFRDAYKPNKDTISIVRYVQNLKEYGSVPPAAT